MDAKGKGKQRKAAFSFIVKSALRNSKLGFSFFLVEKNDRRVKSVLGYAPDKQLVREPLTKKRSPT